MSRERPPAPRPPVPPGRAAVPTPSERVAVPLAFVAGVGVALQAYVNGHLAGEVGSTSVAALLSFTVGLLALVGLALVRGTFPAARTRLRGARHVRPWYFLGGFGGAYLVSSTAAAAPEIGVSLVTVAIVAGQTFGSLGVDAVGLGPAGRQGVTVPRVAGIALAVAAVLLSAFAGGTGELKLGLLLLVAGAGVGVSVQQATNGRLQQVSGDAVFAAVTNFAVGTLALVVLFLLTVPDHLTLAAPPLLYLGGLLGAAFVLVAAATVGVLGVLRLSLVTIAGQSVGALLLDAADPAPGRSLTVATVVGVVLTILAVGVSRLPSRLPGRLAWRR
ncbi:MAG: bacterial/archaeal transporter family-2 protein [Frankiaceae bacterium]|nr:bacterial/archaeal transporter family-2 protein [Frankiaceae bacterium]